jgi:L-alanine-DL-glutamate epimerase-like enolase superfamily enzyme
MKIVDVECLPLSVPLTGADVIRWSGGSAEVLTTVLVRIRTDEGLSGLGETYAGLFAPEVVRSIVEYYRPMLLGRDPLSPAALARELTSRTLFWARSGVGIGTLSALEIALWDIAGQAAGQPVWSLLGGAHRQRLTVYASGGLERPLDETRQEMRQYITQGFKAVKVRVGYGARRDVPKIQAIREVLGEDVQLMVDAVQGHNPRAWTAAEALAVIKPLEPFNLTWFEEPCRATDYEGYARVRASTAIPIAGGESSTTIHEFKRFFDAGGLDIAQPDATFAGGISACREIALLAESHGLRAVPHVWGSGVAVMANLHFAFSVPNCPFVELPVQKNPLRDRLLTKPLKLEDGCFTLPAEPGLGVRLDDELLEEFPYIEGKAVVQ